jgi:SAM-dependent methyltransferase
VGSSGRASIHEAEKFLDFVTAFDPNLKKSLLSKTARVLDFGAGLGRFSALLLDRGLNTHQLTIVDSLEDSLVHLRKIFQSSEISKVGVELKSFAFEHESVFSGVFSYSIFSHLPPELAKFTIHQIVTMLQVDGYFVFTFWDPEIIPVMTRIGLQSSNNSWAEQFSNAFQIYTLEDIKKKGVVYSPSGGGNGLDANVYGDTIMTHEYVRDLLSSCGMSEIVIIPSGQATLQSVVIARKA